MEKLPVELAEALAQCHDIKFDNQAAMNAMAAQSRQPAIAAVLERQRQAIENLIRGLKSIMYSH